MQELPSFHDHPGFRSLSLGRRTIRVRGGPEMHRLELVREGAPRRRQPRKIGWVFHSFVGFGEVHCLFGPQDTPLVRILHWPLRTESCGTHSIQGRFLIPRTARTKGALKAVPGRIYESRSRPIPRNQ